MQLLSKAKISDIMDYCSNYSCVRQIHSARSVSTRGRNKLEMFVQIPHKIEIENEVLHVLISN